jgi:hypothetical protein
MLIAGAFIAFRMALVPAPITGGLLLVGVFALAFAPLVLARTHNNRYVLWLGIAVAVCFAALVLAPQGFGGIANRIFDVALGCWGVAFGLGSIRAKHA